MRYREGGEKSLGLNERFRLCPSKAMRAADLVSQVEELNSIVVHECAFRRERRVEDAVLNYVVFEK